MAIIRAFKGIRPKETMVKEIAALPYDVYNRSEAKEIVDNNPHSFLKIDRAETAFASDIEIHDPKVYAKANELFQEMIQTGALIQDSKDSFYIYQLTMENRRQTGIVACTAIDEYINGTIKKHELTRAYKEQDRIHHVDALDANTGPIFLTYRGEEKIDQMIEEWISNHEPLYDFTADDGITHEFWRFDDEKAMAQLVLLFTQVSSLYIADGHHRAASAVKVGLKRRDEHPNYTGVEEFNYFLSVLFPDHQLKILDYNRVVKDLYGLSNDDFLSKIKESFDILSTSKDPIKPEKKGTFGMYLADTWYLIQAIEGTYNHTDPVLSLDVSILQLNILAPVLGISDPRVDNRIDFIGGIRGLKEIEKRCQNDMCIGFAMVATSVEELMAIADAGELMPPKSTWFEPKLRSGLVSHLLH